MKTSIPFLVLLCLAALVVAACAGSSTPASIADKPAVPGLTALPTVESTTETPSPTVDSATVTPSPTIPKPTATFVPLTTPSATPTGDQPNQNSVRRIGVAEARALAEAGDAILVDVRTQGTYKEAHIAGAVSLPLGEVAERVHTLGDEALIIFYCAWLTEHQSAGAALLALEQGITQVAALRGGWAAWQQAGFPVEGTRVTSPTATAAAWAAAGGVAALGEPDAPVTILDFSDFQWPYCRQHVLQTLPKIDETYIQTGQVRYVAKDFPLPSHANAQVAAEAARCAGVQGEYWAMHGRLFQDQKEWASQAEATVIETMVGYAQDLGLDEEALRLCVESGQFGELIRQDQWEGQQAGVQGTPSFLINGQLFVGAYPYEAFKEFIEAALAGEP